MPQHQLYRTKVRAAFEQVRRKTVPQFMRSQFLANAHRVAKRLGELPHRGASQSAAANADKNILNGRSAATIPQKVRTRVADIILKRFQRFAPRGINRSLLPLPMQ